jgi:hypothetical protein
MKKLILKYTLFLLAAGLLLPGCKRELADQFHNPDIYSKTENLFGGLFLGLETQHKVYVQDYGEYYWQFNAGTEVPGYAQIANRFITDRYTWFSGFNDLSGVSGIGSNSNNADLANHRLDDYYTRCATWAVLKDQLSTITGQALTDNKIYYTLATVIKDYMALVNVDFYNNIPYFDAFKGKDTVFFPKFDDPHDIYKSVLDEWKSISDGLQAEYNAMSDLGKSLFPKYDLAFQGNISLWIQYINALRLKFAVRLSGVDDAFAKTHIQDVLTKPLPTADMTWSLGVDNAPESNGFWLRGLGENSFATFIPDIIMRRMHQDSSKAYQPGIDDPRLPVIAMPTKFFDGAWSATVNRRKYKGISYNADGQKAEYTAGNRYATTPNSFILSLQQNSKSQYNYTTIIQNAKFPVYMMSLAEMDLLLAEIEMKGLGNTGKSAGAHVKDAITHSTDFWYARNGESHMAASFIGKAIANNYFTGPLSFATGRFGEDSALYFHPAKPSPAIVSQFADSIVNRFNTRANDEDRMEIIMQQKYIHLNVMCPYELWAELRRTRHPYLEPFTFTGQVMKPFPERLKYPVSALQTNPDNYLKVKDQDNYTTPIFWVPASKKGVVNYWNDYNYQ